MSRMLKVDWPECRAHGLCHELLPETVRLDEWGYPIITADIGDGALADARAAVRACPRLALRIVETPRD